MIKKITFLIIICLFFSCSQTNKKDNIENEAKEIIDSIQVLNQKKSKALKNNEPMTSENCDKKFEVFFEKFISKEVFQKSRVKFPLKNSFVEDLESGKVNIKLIDINDYNYIDFTKDKDAMNNEFDKYLIEIEKLNNNVNYKKIGYDNGINVIYKFRLVKGCWFLIEVLDKSS